jgi:hypothetical protein
MGQEIECRIRYRERVLSGKAYLESDHVLFRGEERLKVMFRELRTVRAEGGTLHLEFAGGPADLELGTVATKWADKIINPKSRLQKLGIKAGMTLRMVGSFDEDFLAELSALGVQQETRARADLVLLSTEGKKRLQQMRKLSDNLKPGGAIWVIYPKGVEAVREIDVLTAGRAAGLTDHKVASFSITHTGLKFVFPKSRRPAMR